MPSDASTGYVDDQPGDEAYKRGALYKQTKARRADYDSDKEAKRPCTEDSDVALAGTSEEKEARLPKRKVAVMVGYCGTGYHGMQYNPPNRTIEAELFEAFVKAGAISRANSTDLKKNGFMRAARTDKGVHAGGNVISLKLIIEDPAIKDKINEHLPPGIRVWGISRVNKAFDCRKLCGSRWYEYLLPTYSFIGPKPNTYLARTIEQCGEAASEKPDRDQESLDFWEAFRKAVDEKFTQEEQDAIVNYVAPSKEDFDENSGLYQKVKQYKQMENAHRRSYRVSSAKLARFREAMKQYLGPHNFHNYTLGKDFKDPSTVRFMKDITVSDPFVIGEMKTEWVSIKIHGQSFMLHQIRKMISMATLVARCNCSPERIAQSYGPQKINIPKAPALGLLLESPVYEGYNKRLLEFGYEPIDFRNYQKEMDTFKMVHIYDKIYKEEVDENVFNAFFNYIDAFNQVTGAQGEPTKSHDPAKIQLSIIDFLLPCSSSPQENASPEAQKAPETPAGDNTISAEQPKTATEVPTTQSDA
ncbi:AFL105Cp [Eremothecium gossypii ATCC 10895]|uniref:tRNA pseudouridine synthase 1 n=1 Tax=Eremothecium gossypii (strain ATCC 10895 / CBS 109.51 / FGSC 9923 / NRRL Y-1056) TaxID=284811 RepID=PUS1_EREGS|nr:AFL105Cp [Eremothecium gossypii ATCC 10895]Q755C8.2 RecName: Full=tRNA pseudouridine synthase 1; AltName: Full=tRNA pseudouridylate synthase 1; AltName: Full=tRNA-uridine isomerase 1 [Eremothecium gossypii ATCC 10895]AAS53269.2 AFL105Cp [Eremothecium gossypii ATCC 10895]